MTEFEQLRQILRLLSDLDQPATSQGTREAIQGVSWQLQQRLSLLRREQELRAFEGLGQG
jgi:hypothetical protein